MSEQPAEFRYQSYAQEVIFGAGALDRIAEAVARRQRRRLMLCSSRSAPAQDRIREALGAVLVAQYEGVSPHVQDRQVHEAVELARVREVDAIIGIGGGSVIGMAKAVTHALGPGRDDGLPPAPTDRPRVLVIAIPTTYAGSEMTPVFGITHTADSPPRKLTVNDPGITPGLVLYDPSLTLGLPPELTASTGINALAHCIEALYSPTRHPASTAAAASGIRHIAAWLPACHVDGRNVQARTGMLLGAHLAGLALSSVAMALHHGLCHVLGGSAGVPHGIANAIVLPHAIRFNAAAAATELLAAAEAMRISTAGTEPSTAVERLAEAISALIQQLGLPHRLRDAGVALERSDLPQLAALAYENRTVRNNPRRINSAAEIQALLEAAW